MPNVKLDKEIIRGLLQKADERWFANHGGQYKYEEHLEFTADFLEKHYKGGKNAEHKLHHARSRSPGHFEAKARKGHSDTSSQGQLKC